ncbi:MAG: hypothetical protein WCC66_15145 [Rhizobiaceae bacterium]
MDRQDNGTAQTVRHRLVLFFPGFEPLGAEAHRGRFERALVKTSAAYKVQFSATPLSKRATGLDGFSVEGSGPHWQTRTEIAVFDWASILERYENRSRGRRFASGATALAAFVLNGTLSRYLGVSWRYGFFFFYPMVMLAACFAAGVFAALFAGPVWLKFIIALAVTTGTLALASRKAHLLLMMDDWAFAQCLANQSDAVIAEKMTAFQDALKVELSSFAGDEVLVVGHSLGCVFAVDALGAVSSAPDRKVTLMTAGSSLLKIALHKNADWLRERVSRLVVSGCRWLDVQALTDVISFYGSNPATSIGIESAAPPKVLKIRFRHMLSPQSYAKGKYNLFRTHRQFVLGAEQPYVYSLHMMACGPYSGAQIWQQPGLPAQTGS